MVFSAYFSVVLLAWLNFLCVLSNIVPWNRDKKSQLCPTFLSFCMISLGAFGAQFWVIVTINGVQFKKRIRLQILTELWGWCHIIAARPRRPRPEATVTGEAFAHSSARRGKRASQRNTLPRGGARFNCQKYQSTSSSCLSAVTGKTRDSVAKMAFLSRFSTAKDMSGPVENVQKLRSLCRSIVILSLQRSTNSKYLGNGLDLH